MMTSMITLMTMTTINVPRKNAEFAALQTRRNSGKSAKFWVVTSESVTRGTGMMMDTTKMMSTKFDTTTTTTRSPPLVLPGETIRIIWTVSTTDQPLVRHIGRMPLGSTPLGSIIHMRRLQYGKVTAMLRLHPTIHTHLPPLTVHTYLPLLTTTASTLHLHGKVIVTRDTRHRNLIHGQVTRTRRSTRKRNQVQAPLRVLNLLSAFHHRRHHLKVQHHQRA
mmetsp:Transcript_8054/g.10191  ORF Transcript_8054/g.10191 Transcript_8054/m.10191 type:complete len:221 (+) Transcript_8054:125-787(+)